MRKLLASASALSLLLAAIPPQGYAAALRAAPLSGKAAVPSLVVAGPAARLSRSGARAPVPLPPSGLSRAPLAPSLSQAPSKVAVPLKPEASLARPAAPSAAAEAAAPRLASPARTVAAAAASWNAARADIAPSRDGAAPAGALHRSGVRIEEFLTGTRLSAGESPAPGEDANPKAEPSQDQGKGLRAAIPEKTLPRDPYLDGPPAPPGPGERASEQNLKSRSRYLKSRTWTTLALAATLALLPAYVAAQSTPDNPVLVLAAGLLMQAAMLSVMILLPSIVGALHKRLTRKSLSLPLPIPIPGLAEKLPKDKFPGVYKAVGDMAQRAGLAMPRLRILDMPVPNAAAVGARLPFLKTRGNVLFTPLIFRLKAGPLSGVIGHELTHIRENHIALKLLGFVLGLMLFTGLTQLGWAPGWVLLACVGLALFAKRLSQLHEYSSDLGGARLTGRPMDLARGLLHLEFWQRLVGGRSAHPVSNFSPQDLVMDHPPILKRVQVLRRLEDASAPLKRGGPGSLKASLGLLDSVFFLLREPIVIIPLWTIAAQVNMLLPFVLLYLMFKGIPTLQKKLAKLLDKPGLLADRFLAYLVHPDPAVRAMSQGALRDNLRSSRSVPMLLEAQAAVESAWKSESDPALKRSLFRLYLRVRARMRSLPRKAFKDELGTVASVRAQLESGWRVSKAVPGLKALGQAAQKLQDGKLRGYLSALQVRLISPNGDEAPILWLSDGGGALRFLDPATGELFVSSILWQSLKPSERAGFLIRSALVLGVRLKLRKEGKAWAPEQYPAQAKALEKILRLPIKKGSYKAELKAQANALKAYSAAQKMKGRLATEKPWFDALRSKGWLRVLKTALGLGVGYASLLLSGGGFLALAIAFLGMQAAEETLKAIVIEPRKAPLRLLPALLGVAGLALGQPLLVGAWRLLAWVQSLAGSEKLPYALTTLALAGVATAAWVLPGAALGLGTLFALLPMAGLALHLQREGRAAWAAAGVPLLGALYWGLALALPVVPASLVVLFAAHILGNVLAPEKE